MESGASKLDGWGHETNTLQMETEPRLFSSCHPYLFEIPLGPFARVAETEAGFVLAKRQGNLKNPSICDAEEVDQGRNMVDCTVTQGDIISRLHSRLT